MTRWIYIIIFLLYSTKFAALLNTIPIRRYLSCENRSRLRLISVYLLGLAHIRTSAARHGLSHFPHQGDKELLSARDAEHSALGLCNGPDRSGPGWLPSILGELPRFCTHGWRFASPSTKHLFSLQQLFNLTAFSIRAL